MINIGYKIKTILSDSTLETLLGSDNKVCPVIMPNETNYPFMVYRRVGLDEDDNKDSRYDNDIEAIVIVTADYDEGVEIAMKVRDLMEAFTDDDVENISLTDSSEDYAADAFIQNLKFRVENLKK